jgi:putative transposase
MARLPRLVVPNQPHHVVQRGIDTQIIFRDEADHVAFLGWLREAAKQFRVAIHAYVLMPDRLHLLLTPADGDGLGRMMQWVGRHYVPYFNQKYHRTGTLWQGRYKAGIIESDQYFMMCSRFIELCPVLDGLVNSALDYRWSSCAHHVGMRADPVITDHASYWALGNTPFDREAVYKRLIEQTLHTDEITLLNDAAHKGWALGSEKYKKHLEKEINRRVSPAKRGRPSKATIGDR